MAGSFQERNGHLDHAATWGCLASPPFRTFACWCVIQDVPAQQRRWWTLAGQTSTREGGGYWTCPVGAVGDMSPSGRELSAPTIERPVGTPRSARELGVLIVLWHTSWTVLKRPYLETSMGPAWPKWKMKSDFARHGRGITCALPSSVQTARVGTSGTSPFDVGSWWTTSSSLCAREQCWMHSGIIQVGLLLHTCGKQVSR